MYIVAIVGADPDAKVMDCVENRSCHFYDWRLKEGVTKKEATQSSYKCNNSKSHSLVTSVTLPLNTNERLSCHTERDAP
jgi:hypothetical protein